MGTEIQKSRNVTFDWHVENKGMQLKLRGLSDGKTLRSLSVDESTFGQIQLKIITSEAKRKAGRISLGIDPDG